MTTNPPKTRWILIKKRTGSGALNMALDRALEAYVRIHPDTFVLRFYQWEPDCISLGKNQALGDLDLDRCRSDGIDVVYRPTGGRAVYHADELTYSTTFHRQTLAGGIQETYAEISEAFVIALNALGLQANFEPTGPDFRQHYGTPASVLCFSTSARHEVQIGGRKLIGSAQHRSGDVVLQHGSILVGTRHQNIVNYLRAGNTPGHVLLKTLTDKTVSISELTPVDAGFVDRLEDAITEGFKRSLGAEFVEMDPEALLGAEVVENILERTKSGSVL